MKKKFPLHFLALIGYAGQGKDTVKDLLIEEFAEVDFFNLTFAEVMKQQVADVLPQDLINLTGKKNKAEALNALKDDYPNIKIFKNLNARELLQRLGTEFYRELDPNIHVRFCAQKILNKLGDLHNEDYAYVSSDTRFPNELDFILSIGQIKDREKEQDYLKHFLNTSKRLPSYSDFYNHYVNVFEIKDKDFSDPIVKKLVERLYVEVSQLKEEHICKYNWKDVKIPNTLNCSIKEGLQYGVFHVFRPIIPNKISKDCSKEELKKAIIEYTGLDDFKVEKIIDCYEKYNIGFTTETVQRYGFLRADITHYSETALSDRKPVPFISVPCKSEVDFKNLQKNILINFEEEPKKKRKLKKNK